MLDAGVTFGSFLGKNSVGDVVLKLDACLRAHQPCHLPHPSIWSSFFHFCAFIVASPISAPYLTLSLTFSVFLLLFSYSCCIQSLFCSYSHRILLLQHRTALHKECMCMFANVSACIKKYQHTQDFFHCFPYLKLPSLPFLTFTMQKTSWDNFFPVPWLSAEISMALKFCQ